LNKRQLSKAKPTAHWNSLFDQKSHDDEGIFLSILLLSSQSFGLLGLQLCVLCDQRFAHDAHKVGRKGTMFISDKSSTKKFELWPAGSTKGFGNSRFSSSLISFRKLKVCELMTCGG
jgi:hypothetical protein